MKLATVNESEGRNFLPQLRLAQQKQRNYTLEYLGYSEHAQDEYNNIISFKNVSIYKRRSDNKAITMTMVWVLLKNASAEKSKEFTHLSHQREL